MYKQQRISHIIPYRLNTCIDSRVYHILSHIDLIHVYLVPKQFLNSMGTCLITGNYILFLGREEPLEAAVLFQSFV